MTAENPIKLTPEAYKQALHLQKTEKDYESKALRLYIDGKGCDGFFYGVTFDEKTREDLSFSIGDIELIVDPQCLFFTEGSEIAWVDDERGKGFLVENPNHKKFKGKFYKRKSFLPRFTEHNSQHQAE